MDLHGLSSLGLIFDNLYFRNYEEHCIQMISEYENNSWHIYCKNHPLMNLANSCLSNISPSQFWAISEQYPDLVKHLQQHVRLMSQFGLNGGIPWLSNTDGALFHLQIGN